MVLAGDGSATEGQTGLACSIDDLDSLIVSVPVALALVEESGIIGWVNDAYAELVGRSREDLTTETVEAAIPLVNRRGTPISSRRWGLYATLYHGETVRVGAECDYFLDRSEDDRKPVQVTVVPVRRGRTGRSRAVVVVEPIGKWIARHPTTGLPTYLILQDRIEAAHAKCPDGWCPSLVVIVVDRADRIRQAFGSAGVDALARSVTSRIWQDLERPEIVNRAPDATLSYLPDLEFAVLIPHAESRADAVEVAQVLQSRLTRSLPVGDVDVDLTVSVSVGAMDDEADPSTFIASVAATAREASAEGGNRLVPFTPDLHVAVTNQLRREHELHLALQRYELLVHYQPQIRLSDGAPVAVEALVRWDHPTRGLLGAGDVISLAVSSGLIREVGWWVLERSCSELAGLRDDDASLDLSVNVAAEQLAQPDAVTRVISILDRANFDPNRLILEINEGTVIDNIDEARSRLEELRSIGVRVAVDDFGTGHSSLMQLRNLPIDILKVDQQFVGSSLTNEVDRAIVRASILLAHALDMEVVAEGVEDYETAELLRTLSCELGQGYYWARPAVLSETLETVGIDQSMGRTSIRAKRLTPARARTYGTMAQRVLNQIMEGEAITVHVPEADVQTAQAAFRRAARAQGRRLSTRHLSNGQLRVQLATGWL